MFLSIGHLREKNFGQKKVDFFFWNFQKKIKTIFLAPSRWKSWQVVPRNFIPESQLSNETGLSE